MSKRKKNVAFITSGYFPVPATLGGAVEALDENLIKQNEISQKINLTFFSCYEKQAKKIAETYNHTQFEFVKIPKSVQFLDKMIYFIAKNFLKKSKNMSYRYILQRLFYIYSVARKIKKCNYDALVLENHSTLFMTLKLFSNYKKYKGKYYYHIHNKVTNDYGCREIIRNCKKVLGVSNYINNELLDFLKENDDSNKYCVWKNKIDRNKFLISLSDSRKSELRQQFGIKENEIIILFSGRFNPEKGIKELLIAYKRVHFKNVKLLVVGSYYFGSKLVSEFEQEMKQLTEDMKDRICFTGFIPYNKMPEIYVLADIVVIPSIWDDPAPLTVIEALTSGKPLITTYSGGIPEYADSDSSIIIKRDNELIENLANAIESLLISPEKVYKMKQLVINKTLNWTVESYYDDFCQFIKE